MALVLILLVPKKVLILFIRIEKDIRLELLPERPPIDRWKWEALYP